MVEVTKKKSSKKSKPFALVEKAIEDESGMKPPNSYAEMTENETVESEVVESAVKIAEMAENETVESEVKIEPQPENIEVVPKRPKRSSRALIKEALVTAIANEMFEEGADAESEAKIEPECEVESKEDSGDMFEKTVEVKSEVKNDGKSDEISINNSEETMTDETVVGETEADSGCDEQETTEEPQEVIEEPQEIIEEPPADQPVWKTLYTYCERCKDYVYAYYQEKMITEATAFPVYMVWVHGRPLHGLLLRIDRNFTSRGERIVNIEFDMHSLQPPE